MDGDECLYEHGKADSQEKEHGVCASGKACRDQSCKFSDKEHRQLRDLCKFQANCNRLNCIFRHMVSRKVFLDVGASIQNKK